MTAGPVHDGGLHLLVLFGADLPPDLAGRAARASAQVDLASASLATLRGHAEQEFDEITLVAPGWSHLRMAVVPARLLGSAQDVVIRLTADTARTLRPTAVGPLGMKGATVALSGTGEDHATIQVRRGKAMKLSEVLRGLLGPDPAFLPAPPRLSLTSRLLEPYAVGNPFARYAGVDDEIVSVHHSLSTVDLVLENTGGEAAPSPTSELLPRVSVTARPAGPHVDGALVSLPPVDPMVVNPIGFDAGEKTRTARLEAVGTSGDGVRLVDDKGAELFTVGPQTPLTRRQVQATRRCRYAEVDGEPAVEAGTLAALLAQLAAAGLPLCAPRLSPDVEQLLGAEVSAEITRATAELFSDPVRREVASVRLRRAAYRQHSPAAVGARIAAAAGLRPAPLPLVSVVLVTRRPGFLAGALAQIDRQTWPNLEVVVGLHGDSFDGDQVRAALDGIARASTVVRVPQSAMFGDALNAACGAANGTYLTKWDDDDLYGAHHVEDLLHAADYSGAALVGKGSNFTVLEELGETVRGPNPSSERRVRNVAGGTFLLRPSTLEDIGGWRSLPYSVDRALLGQVLDAGLQIYRTHQMGYLLRRHGHGHTWDPGLDYFLDNATDRWPVTAPRQRLVLETEFDG